MSLEQGVLLAMVAAWFAATLWSRILGGVLGVLASAGVAAWGYFVFHGGRQIHVLGLARPLNPGAFYTLMSLMVLINALAALSAWRQRRTVPGA